jgi:hypothetical protein
VIFLNQQNGKKIASIKKLHGQSIDMKRRFLEVLSGRIEIAENLYIIFRDYCGRNIQINSKIN